MGVNTQGITSPEITLDQIILVLESKFNVIPKVEKTHTNKDKVTLIDLNLWGSSIELIRGIVEEFGGEMVEADTNDDWFGVEKIS